MGFINAVSTSTVFKTVFDIDLSLAGDLCSSTILLKLLDIKKVPLFLARSSHMQMKIVSTDISKTVVKQLTIKKATKIFSVIGTAG